MKWRPAHFPHRRGPFKRPAVLLLIACGVAAAWLVHSLKGRAGARPAGRAGGDAALYSPAERAAGMGRVVTHLHVSGVPVEEVVAELGRQTGVRIVVRWDELAERGTLRSAPVSIGLDGVPLEKALRAAFEEDGSPVCVCEDHGAVTVCGTAPPPADPVVRAYDLRDLLGPFSAQTDPPRPGTGGVTSFGGRSLFGFSGRIGPAPWPDSQRERACDRLVSMIEPILWAYNERININVWGGRLMIVATERTQWEVETFLGALRRATGPTGPGGSNAADGIDGAGAGGAYPVWPVDPDPDPLSGRVVPELDIPPMPLEKALAELHRQTGAGIVLQASNLSRAQLEWTVQAQFHDVTVVDAMNKILLQVRPHPPLFRVSDNLLYVSDQFPVEIAGFALRVYDVRALLPASVPPSLEPDPEPAVQELIRSIERSVRERSTDNRATGDERSLINVWDRALVITETPENHRQIVRLLETLRQRKEREHP